MSKNITIARLNTLVTANAAQFTSELDKASAVAKTRGKSINSAFSGIGSQLAGALSVGAVIGFGKSIIDLGGQISDLASVADLSQRGFQAISTLAGDSGVKMEEVAKASETMRQKLQDAKANASDPLNDSLRKLGLTATALSGLNTEQKWEVIASALVHAKDQQEAMNIASDIFGTKIGPKLRGTFDEIAGGVENAAAKMGGLILTDEQLKKLDLAGDKLARMGRFAQVFTVNLLEGSVGFDAMWRDMKSIAGFGEKISKHDIRTRGEYILPGGTAKPSGDSRQKELQDKMLAATRAAAIDDDKKYREELRQIEQRKQQRQRDPKYWLKQREQVDSYRSDIMELVLGKSGSMTGLFEDMKRKQSPVDLGTPTDSYSRIGLLTSDRTPPEQSVQTEHLKQIEDTLKKIRTLLANPNSENLAAYAN